MSVLFLLYLFISYCSYCSAWDQITVPAFRKLFPYHELGDVWQLTFHINRQKTPKNARDYLNNWIDEYWPTSTTEGATVTQPEETTTVPPETSTVADGQLKRFENLGYNGMFHWGTVGTEEATTVIPEMESTVLQESGTLGYFHRDYYDSNEYDDFEYWENDQGSTVGTVTRAPIVKVTHQYKKCTDGSDRDDYVYEDQSDSYEDYYDDSEDSENSKFSTVPLEKTTVGTVTVDNLVRGKRNSGVKMIVKMEEKGNTKSWEDAWFKMDQVKTVTPPYQNRCLSEKEFARQEALSFLEHRETLKMYIRYIFRIGQQEKLFTKKEAEQMRSIFWKNDRLYKNNFIQVEPAFLYEVTYKHKWEKSSSVISSNLKAYAEHWYKFLAEKLNRSFIYYYPC